MADTDTETLPNGTGTQSEDDERMKQRPADIDADVREMERRKRVEALMSSKLFREELERVLDQQMHEGADAPLLQRIKEMVGGRLHTGSFRGPSCVLPINDIRGIEGVGYEKGEKILRCKLAALYRLVDLFGWTQCGVASQLTARLNTAVEQLLISPRGLMPHEVTASSLLKVDMQGTVIDSGTTNYGVHKSGFSVHAAVHAARPDVRCVLHLRSPPVLAISATKQGLLPLCTEAALIGEVAYHRVPTGILDNEERDKIVRVLGPSCKILFLRSQGALCCGSTLEEAFYHAKHLHTAADVQLKLATVPRDQLAVMDDEERKEVYDASRAEGAAESSKWRAGGEEFEALMRMLDNAGFRTGYIYRNPLVKNDVPRPKNDVEVPPAVSSLGYLLEEEEMYRLGIWKKGQGKTGERTRWLNSPNVYQKVEVLETGTNDPKKITKTLASGSGLNGSASTWVDSHNEEWVTDGSPGHSSTPMKIDAALQFVPKNTNPKEFRALQQQIKDNRRADKISAGPQSHILEGVTWDEANRLNAEDASATHAGDHVVLVGAASKGIIQRGYQHNATVYSAPYARNPFEHVSERDLDEYTRRVTGQGNYDTDLSESEAISAAQMTSPVSETETESRDEHRVLRIETKQAPMRSQPEVVLSDDATDFLNAERSHVDRTRGNAQNPELTRSPNPSTANKKRDYPRCPNFESLILKYDTPKSDPKCKVNLKKRYDSEPTHADAVEIYNPGCLSSRGSLNSVPSIEWDVKKTDNFRSQSLPRKLCKKFQQQRYYRSCSHAGFINQFIKNPEPIHYHVPKCRKCGSFNSSYDWEITKRDLKSLGQSSIWHSYENIHKSCLREGDRKVLAICDVVRVKEIDAPVFDVNTEFIDSEEYNEDCYLENTYLSSSTVVENAGLNLVDADAVVVDGNVNANMLDSGEKATAYTENNVKNADVTCLDIASEEYKRVDQHNINQDVVKDIKSGQGVHENGVYRAECVYTETSDDSDKADRCKSSNNSPESNIINTDTDDETIQDLPMGIEDIAIDKQVEGSKVNAEISAISKCGNLGMNENENPSYVDSSVYRVFRAVLKELKSKLSTLGINDLLEKQIDFTVDNVEGEYLNFSNELDFDRAVYDSPVINLITKDVRDFLVPLNFYSVNDSPSKYNTSVGKALETIVEETKVSDSSNDSVKDSSGEKDIDRNNIDIKVAFAIPNSNDDSENTGKARTELYINLEDNNPSMKDCLDIVHNVQEDKEIELPERKNSVADLSCLEVCENFKISIESSSNEIPSFDSTAEFEKIEAVADVLSILIKRVSITIVNKDENDFYATVDQALKVKHKGVKFFDLREIEQDFIAGKNQEVELYLEPEAEQTSTDRYDINDDQAEQPVILNDENENRCKEEIFSIVEIVKNIDQETVGQNLTVLSEDSDLDPKTHPFKVCESIVYHIFCTMYCKIKQKDKRDNGNSKAVVTVVDIEDIMFTALPIWDIALINEMPVDIEEAGEKCKPTVDAETSEHGASCNSSEVIMEDNQMSIENVLLLSNDNENKDEIEGKEADYDMYLEFDLKDKVNVEEVNVHISSHCEQEGLVAVQSKIVDMNVETIAAEEVLTKVALPEGNAMRNDALELQKEKPDENSECLMVHKNYNVSEDTAYSLINDIINNFDDNTVNAEGGVIVSIVNSAVKEDDCLFPQAEETVYSETLSEASDTASTLTQDTTFNSCELESNVAASEVNFNKEELESVKNEDCYTQSEGFTENRYIGYAQVASDSPEGLTQPHTKIHALKDLIIDSDDIQTENLVKNLDLIDITQSAQKLEEEINLNISSVLVGNEQEDAIKENELVAVEEINRIVLNITDSLDKCKGANVTRSNSHTIEDQDVIKETTLIAVEEIPQIILSVPDCIDECDQDNAVTADSELPIRVTVTEIKSLELPVSNLNPNAAAFVMKFCEYAETTNIEIHENDIDLNVSVIVKQDVFDILDDVLEVVSSMHERYSNENTYSVSPVESNESVEGLCVDELNFASTNKSSVTEIGAIEDEEDKEAFKILAIDVRKSLKEIRLSHTSNRDETTGSSDDDPIVLDVYDTKSYGKDKENKYEYGEYYDDSSNGSNKDNGELYIEKHGTPKFVDLVARDEDGSIDSITYNSHILQSLVENLLQDVISEFVIDDNVSEIINTEVTQDPKVADGVDRSGTNFDINKNETFVLDSNNLNIEIQNTTADSALCEISDGDMAYESCSKTDLDQTYVLGTEPAKDNSELTEDVSYFDTAFCEDTMLTNQSSPYKNNSPIFTSCDESPIKNPNTAYLDDSMLYDKCDEISPFDKTVAVQSMSQGVNSGGIKYWVSFDDSFTEIDDKVKSNRGEHTLNGDHSDAHHSTFSHSSKEGSPSKEVSVEESSKKDKKKKKGLRTPSFLKKKKEKKKEKSATPQPA